MANQYHKVELWTCWGWTCDECGRDNFERGVTAELTPEDAQHIADTEGVPLSEVHGCFMTQPCEVTCDFCGTEFDVEEPQ